MPQISSPPNAENTIGHLSHYETSLAPLFLQDFCSASFIKSLKPDPGLRAFARLPEREHQLLVTIGERSDSIVTLAYTAQGLIVGQVTLAPADDYWQDLPNIYEIAVEVSASWRGQGIARQLLRKVFELDCLNDLIIIGMGLTWHWDTEGLGLTPFAYRAMVKQMFSRHGFAEHLTSEGNIRMDAANIFLARFGPHVSANNLSQFYNRLLQSDTLPGM